MAGDEGQVIIRRRPGAAQNSREEISHELERQTDDEAIDQQAAHQDYEHPHSSQGADQDDAGAHLGYIAVQQKEDAARRRTALIVLSAQQCTTWAFKTFDSGFRLHVSRTKIALLPDVDLIYRTYFLVDEVSPYPQQQPRSFKQGQRYCRPQIQRHPGTLPFQIARLIEEKLICWLKFI
jgi:hypothetical protein